MARRPFAFGARFSQDGRTVRLRQSAPAPGRYTVEVSRRGQRSRTTRHASLASAFRAFAEAWRARLH